MTEIKPALTAEEWVKALFQSSQEGALAITVGMREDLAAPGTPECRAAYHHALAALCLKDKPFGFTREDVEILRAGVDSVPALDHVQGSLADRIEALLPPEE